MGDYHRVNCNKYPYTRVQLIAVSRLAILYTPIARPDASAYCTQLSSWKWGTRVGLIII